MLRKVGLPLNIRKREIKITTYSKHNAMWEELRQSLLGSPVDRKGPEKMMSPWCI